MLDLDIGSLEHDVVQFLAPLVCQFARAARVRAVHEPRQTFGVVTLDRVLDGLVALVGQTTCLDARHAFQDVSDGERTFALTSGAGAERGCTQLGGRKFGADKDALGHGGLHWAASIEVNRIAAGRVRNATCPSIFSRWYKKAYKKAAYKSSRKYANKAGKSRRYASAPRKAKKSYSSNSYSGGSSGGLASYYWQPQRVASGGWFNPNAMTAAHKTLPFGTKVRVTNSHNGRSVVVTINDRGPYIKGRVIDLSSAAAGVIGMKGAGVVPISMSVLGR